MGFDIQQTLLWIVLLPLLGALINGLYGKSASRGLVSGVAVGSVFCSFLLSLLGFGFLLSSADDPARQAIVYDFYEWFSIDVRGVDVAIRVRFVMDHLSGIMSVMVTGIAALIHVYSIGYMEEDDGYARFMTYLNLFTASMLILVLASNVPLMFVGWEGVGLCSYLLIGFWFKNVDYAAAGRKAFVVNRIGDFGVLIGMFLLVAAVGTSNGFEFQEINAAASAGTLNHGVTIGTLTLDSTIATVAALFLFLGVCGKSAQFPLLVWLPDAMAGPTPVSALIHAATMVTAGVYLLCRLSPVFVESPYAMAFIAAVGAFTALFAASIALVQNQMKKILAYSTVSQLGFMVAACGMGAFAGGFFHVFTHAFFKACLFLGAGSVMHAIHSHSDADIRYLGGLRHKLKKTHITFAVATAAIAGFPLTSGFFSKDEILLGAATWATGSPYGAFMGWIVFGTLVVAATMTAFYMFRLYFRTFWGDYKGGHPPVDEHAHDDHGDDDHHHGPVEPHESPDTMTVPLYALAAGALVVGVLALPHAWGAPNWWSEWLTPSHEVFAHEMHEAADPHDEATVIAATNTALETPSAVASLRFRDPTISSRVTMVHGASWAPWAAMGAGVLAFLIGFGLAYVWYVQQDGSTPAGLMKSMPGLHRALMEKWYLDELYGFVIVAPMKWLGVFAANIDRFFVDGLLTRVSAAGAKALGFVLTRAQNGVVFAYAGLFVAGLAVLGWWFTYPHAGVEGEASVGEIQWTASRGLAYEYRWDFDSDDEWDTEWSAEPTASHRYAGDAYYALVAVLEAPRSMFGPEEVFVAPGEGPVELPTVNLAPDWVRPVITTDGEEPGAFDAPTPPTLTYEDGRLVIQINDANLVDSDGGDDERVTLSPGETVSLGGGRLTVAVLVRGTVEVRNAFGNRSRGSADVVLRVSPNAQGGEPRAEVVR